MIQNNKQHVLERKMDRYIRLLCISSVSSHAVVEQVAAKDAGQTTERIWIQTHERQWNPGCINTNKQNPSLQHWLKNRAHKEKMEDVWWDNTFRHFHSCFWCCNFLHKCTLLSFFDEEITSVNKYHSCVCCKLDVGMQDALLAKANDSWVFVVRASGSRIPGHTPSCLRRSSYNGFSIWQDLTRTLQDHTGTSRGFRDFLWGSHEISPEALWPQ